MIDGLLYLYICETLLLKDRRITLSQTQVIILRNGDAFELLSKFFQQGNDFT